MSIGGDNTRISRWIVCVGLVALALAVGLAAQLCQSVHIGEQTEYAGQYGERMVVWKDAFGYGHARVIIPALGPRAHFFKGPDGQQWVYNSGPLTIEQYTLDDYRWSNQLGKMCRVEKYEFDWKINHVR